MKKTVLIIFSFLGISLFAQDIVLQGTIKDQQGNLLEMANVIALNADTKAVSSYHITDNTGSYTLSLKNNTKYNIRVSYIGLETSVKTIETKKATTALTLNFNLLEKTNTLDTVEITYEMPVTIKGDTIIYKADAFTTGKEKKLEDVLTKLPGVDINDDGEVEVDGKKVTKIMVEGKDFFDGDTKLAQKNIPANAIDKIEVLKNYNEVSQMRGLENDEDSMAINIKLKEGKERFWFGEVTAGAGIDERYLAHPKLFYYSPKKSINILTDFNNIGEIPFTMRDYFKFSGGFKDIMKKGRSAIRTSSEQLGFSLVKNDRANAITSRFAALNFNYEINNKLDFNGFAIYNDADTALLTENKQVYTEAGITDLKTNTSLLKNKLGMLKLSANYKPNTDFQLDYDVMAKKSAQTEAFNTHSTLDGVIDTQQEQMPFSINQNLNIYYTLSDKHIFSFGTQHLIDNNKPTFTATSLEAFFEYFSLIQMEEEDSFVLAQNKTQSTQKLDLKLDYFYVLNNKSNLNFTLGNTNTAQTLASNIQQILDNGNTIVLSNPALLNDASFYYNDLFLATHYKVKLGKLTITPGVSVHQFNLKDIQGNEATESLQRVLPDFFAQYKFKSNRSLRAEYGISTQFSDISKYATGLLLTDYNSLSGGSRGIESSLYHNYSLRYFDFNMFNFTNIVGTITYNKKYNSLKTTTNIIETERISLPVNLTSPDENLRGYLRYGRRFGKFKAKASGSVDLARYYSIINTVEKESKSISQTYKASLSTRFKKAPNFELGYKLAISDYTNNTINTTFITDKPYANIEVSFLKDFIWTADYSYYFYRNTDGSSENKYSFLSSKLYYQKKDSSWEFILSGTNLLQTSSIDTNTASNLMISSSKYYVQPNYFMFSIKYDL